MKRILAVALLFVLAACGDVPTEVPLERQNARGGHVDDASGGSTTWMFEAYVSYTYGDVPVTPSSTLVAWVTFHFTSGDQYPWYVCYDDREARITVTYVIDGEVTMTESGNGTVFNYADVCGAGSYFYFWLERGDNYADFFIYNDDNEIPTGPPDVDTYKGSYFRQWIYDSDGEYLGRFGTRITYFYAGPESMRDCKDGGWEYFGFTDELQCIAMVKKSGASR